MSRLTIDITTQKHQAFKEMTELRQLLAALMEEASHGEISTKSISEIAAEVLQTGGKAWQNQGVSIDLD